MILVNSQEEIDKIRPYREHYKMKANVYPKRYPAFVGFIRHDGGLGGDYYTLKVLEVPKNVDVKSFIAGVRAEPKEYGEEVFTKK